MLPSAGVRAIDPSAYMCLCLFQKRRLRGNLLHTSRHILRLGNLQFVRSQKDSPKQVASDCLCCARKGIAQNRWLPNACAFFGTCLGETSFALAVRADRPSPRVVVARDGEKGEGRPALLHACDEDDFFAKVFEWETSQMLYAF